jgi:hypothetical protein
MPMSLFAPFADQFAHASTRRAAVKQLATLALVGTAVEAAPPSVLAHPNPQDNLNHVCLRRCQRHRHQNHCHQRCRQNRVRG